MNLILISISILITISVFVHIIMNKKNDKPYVGYLVFIILSLSPLVLAYSSKLVLEIFHPKLYEIIEPLGEDFKGFSMQDSRSFFELYQQYPDIIAYGDGPYAGEYDKKVKNRNLHELINKEEYEKYLPSPQHNYIFVRYFLEDTNIRKDRCDIIRIKDGKDWFKIAEEKYAKGEKLSVNQELYIKHNKCVAVKPIYKEETSKYIKNEDVNITTLINVPGLINIQYRKKQLYKIEGENKELAWVGWYEIQYDFYGSRLNKIKPILKISLNKDIFKELITKIKE